MATWQELSRDSLEAAKILVQEGRLRSSISRSYYAAYAAVTDVLIKQGIGRFAQGRNNPGHDQLLSLIGYNLKQSRGVRRRIRKLVRMLREGREVADYKPGISIERTLARASIRWASLVMQQVGVSDETNE